MMGPTRCTTRANRQTQRRPWLLSAPCSACCPCTSSTHERTRRASTAPSHAACAARVHRHRPRATPRTDADPSDGVPLLLQQRLRQHGQHAGHAAPVARRWGTGASGGGSERVGRQGWRRAGWRVAHRCYGGDACCYWQLCVHVQLCVLANGGRAIGCSRDTHLKQRCPLRAQRVVRAGTVDAARRGRWC